MSHILFRTQLMIQVLVSITLACPAASWSAQDRLGDANSPDFTALYSVSRHSKLSDMTQDEVTSQVNSWYGSVKNEVVGGLSPIYKSYEIFEIMNEVRGARELAQDTMLVSTHDGKLLFRDRRLDANQLFIFVYNGKQSMSTMYGSDAQIYNGLHYEYMRDFVFPGFGVCGFPMMRSPSPVLGHPGMYVGQVAANDGLPAQDGSIGYLRGHVLTTNIGGSVYITQTVGGDPGIFLYDCQYSNYVNVGGGLMLPSQIVLKESSRPGSVLKYGTYDTIVYKLIKGSNSALPDNQFQFESQLNQIGLVEDDTSSNPGHAIRYVPGKSISQQFADAEAAQTREKLASLPDTSNHTTGGLLGLIAVVFAICGWFLYRRSIAENNKGA